MNDPTPNRTLTVVGMHFPCIVEVFDAYGELVDARCEVAPVDEITFALPEGEYVVHAKAMGFQRVTCDIDVLVVGTRLMVYQDPHPSRVDPAKFRQPSHPDAKSGDILAAARAVIVGWYELPSHITLPGRLVEAKFRLERVLTEMGEHPRDHESKPR